jgi:integration host factor subunit beta
MTKAELVEDVAEAAELTKKDAERLVEIVFESIIETLNQGEKIELRGFGSFTCANEELVAAEIPRPAIP